MRLYTSILFYALIALLSFLISSCDKMDDIQKQYTDEAENIYLGKVDSVEVVPGFGRVKLKWELSADPRVERVKIYWNNRQDSTSKAFNRSGSGNINDSLIIENLTEGIYTFELKTENDLGNTSLLSIVSGSVWGPNKGDELGNRTITSFGYNNVQSSNALELSPVEIINPDERLVFSEITYTTSGGSEKVVKISSDTLEITLEDFAAGSEFSLRDVFVSKNVFDTVYNNLRTYTAPTVVEGMTQSLGVKGNPNSDYFSYRDSLIWEWKQNSEVISYSLDGNGTVQNEIVLKADAFSRDSFDVLFHYNEDLFITVSPAGDVAMHALDSDTIAQVLTPDGASVMGTGFTNFRKYVPANSYFYTVTDGSGELKIWLAKEDATWGSPNGSTVGLGYEEFKVLIMHNSALWGIDQEGFLWKITLKINGAPNTLHCVGNGWGRFDDLISIGSFVFALDQSGDFYMFQDMPEVSEYRVLN